jgi:hypothetical protein
LQTLKAEMAEREVRSVAYQLKTACFPVYRDLTGSMFAVSETNEAVVLISFDDAGPPRNHLSLRRNTGDSRRRD